MGTTMIESPTLPMKSFMRDLVRRTSLKEAETTAKTSAKSVLDFEDNASACSNSNHDDSTSNHDDPSDHFDLNGLSGLVLVSDNARVFANARPQNSRGLLTSQSWHSNSELRKMHTANARWTSSPDTSISPPSSLRNLTDSKNSSGKTRSKRYGGKRTSIRRTPSDSFLNLPPSRRPSLPPRQQDKSRPPMTRHYNNISNNKSDSAPITSRIRQRTSDSCLTVPKRSWMNESNSSNAMRKPTLNMNLNSSSRNSSFPVQRTSDSCLAMPKRKWLEPGTKTLVRSKASTAATAALSSQFASDPLQTALEARRSLHSRQSDEDSLLSSRSTRSSTPSLLSSRSNESFNFIPKPMSVRSRQNSQDQLLSFAQANLRRSSIRSKSSDSSVGISSCSSFGSFASLGDENPLLAAINALKQAESPADSDQEEDVKEGPSSIRDSKEFITCSKSDPFTLDNNSNHSHHSHHSHSSVDTAPTKPVRRGRAPIRNASNDSPTKSNNEERKNDGPKEKKDIVSPKKESSAKKKDDVTSPKKESSAEKKDAVTSPKKESSSKQKDVVPSPKKSKQKKKKSETKTKKSTKKKKNAATTSRLQRSLEALEGDDEKLNKSGGFTVETKSQSFDKSTATSSLTEKKLTPPTMTNEKFASIPPSLELPYEEKRPKSLGDLTKSEVFSLEMGLDPTSGPLNLDPCPENCSDDFNKSEPFGVTDSVNTKRKSGGLRMGWRNGRASGGGRKLGNLLRGNSMRNLFNRNATSSKKNTNNFLARRTLSSTSTTSRDDSGNSKRDRSHSSRGTNENSKKNGIHRTFSSQTTSPLRRNLKKDKAKGSSRDSGDKKPSSARNLELAIAGIKPKIMRNNSSRSLY